MDGGSGSDLWIGCSGSIPRLLVYDTCVKTGICDRTLDHIVSENSWPLFLYLDYSVNPDDLEQGLFKSKILPGPFARCRVTKLLEWWTRKVFGRNHHEDLTPEVVSKMSVTALADQRMAQENAAFDLD
ncbi:hypothetical protein BDR03DRAFT_1019294 [Suillus americanus]|nr:hypothetical protein BDR03DRAFT_1019294 [Suillus americanus]